MDPSSLSSGLSGFPALLPPPGLTSDFIHPYSIGQQVTIASIICVTLMILCVIIRFYTKLFIKHVWGWNDYFCIPAMVGAIGFAATSISLVHDGIGPHQWNVPISAFTPAFLRKLLVVDVIYSPSILMAKLSLLLLYLEVFRPNVKLRYFIYLGIVFNVLFYTSTMVAFFVFYMPRPGQSLIQVLYAPNTAKGIVLAVVQGGVNVGSDFYILCLPISGVWQLQLAPKQKVGILAIFLTGLLACLSSIIGLYYRTKLGRYSDVTYDLVPVLVWVVVELCVGVMCSCLPSFAGFFRYHLPLLRSIMSLFGSLGSKMRARSFRKPFSQSSGSDPKKLFTKDIKVTLGSRVDGKGRFLSTGSVFAKEDHWQNLTDSNMSPDHDPKWKGTHREYFERQMHDDDVEYQPTRPQRIKTLPTQPQNQNTPSVEISANE